MYSIYNLYKINSNDCYIGKTKNVKARMVLHKYYSKSSTYKLYEFMRANGGFENFEYEILETDISEAQGPIKERYYYNLYKPSLNNNVPAQSQEQSQLQYRTNNKFKLLEKTKLWQANNKEKYMNYQKQYYQNKKLSQLSNNETQTTIQPLQI